MNWCNATGLNFMKKLEYFKEEEWKEKEKGRGKLGKRFKAKIRLTFFCYAQLLVLEGIIIFAILVSINNRVPLKNETFP